MFTQDMKDMSRILHDLLSVWFSVGTISILILFIFLLFVPYGGRKLVHSIILGTGTDIFSTYSTF
jgi:hypothetical protein